MSARDVLGTIISSVANCPQPWGLVHADSAMRVLFSMPVPARIALARELLAETGRVVAREVGIRCAGTPRMGEFVEGWNALPRCDDGGRGMSDAIGVVMNALSNRTGMDFLDAVAIINALIEAGHMEPARKPAQVIRLVTTSPAPTPERPRQRQKPPSQCGQFDPAPPPIPPAEPPETTDQPM